VLRISFSHDFDVAFFGLINAVGVAFFSSLLSVIKFSTHTMACVTLVLRISLSHTLTQLLLPFKSNQLCLVILHELQRRGLHCVFLEGVYPDEREIVLARAKVVLNGTFFCVVLLLCFCCGAT
jgi:hypothetical protein